MKAKDFFKGLAALVFLIFLIILGWALFTSMVKVFGDYTSTVEPTIVVAIISGLGAIIVNAVSKSSERKNQAFMKSKEKMTDIYETFLNELHATTDEDIIKLIFSKYKSVFAVNSSDDTYREFLALESIFLSKKNADRLIIAIRNELKLSSKKNTKQIDENKNNKKR